MSGKGSFRRAITQHGSMVLVVTMGCVLETGRLRAQPVVEAPTPVVVGVVRDGPPPDEDLVARVEAELSKQLPNGMVVELKQEPSFNAGWDTSRIAAALQSALEDPEVDYILADGLYVTLEAAREGVQLGKPVVSTFVQRADLFRLPYTEGDRSLKENLSFTVLPQRLQNDIETFREMIPFESLHVTLDADDMQLMPGLASGLEELEREMGLDIRFALTSDNLSDILASVDESIEAVYLTRTPRLSFSQRQQLITGLTQKGIPTFSLLGHPDVRLGALAGMTPDITEQLVRRIALNLSRLIRGGSVDELPVLLSVDSRLLVNASTAVAVGYSPNLETRVFAEFLHAEALSEARADVLRLSEAMAQAASNNTFLSIQDELVESVRQDQARTRSALLPQVLTNLQYSKANIREELRGVFPESAAVFGLSIQQLIFDDTAISNYQSSSRFYEGSELQREAERTNVLGAAGTAFLGLGLTQAIYDVEVDNLRLSEANLELARLRRDVGYSGPDEIYRWESVVAQSRSNLFTAARDVESARITLNQVLGVDQNRRWLPEEIPVDPDVFPFLGGRVDPMFQQLERWNRFREELVRFAIENAPEVKSIDRRLEASGIQVGQLKRRYFVPSAFFDFSYRYRLAGGNDDLPSGDKDFYIFSIGANYAVFEGARKSADIAKAEADRRALEKEREFMSEIVERDTRTALRGCDSSFPRIKFTRQAAEAAANNLRIVQDKYAEGIVNVTDLISAQNEKLVSDQVAAAAVYEFLIDLVGLQRAISWFEADKAPEEQDAFMEQMMSAVESETSR